MVVYYYRSRARRGSDPQSRERFHQDEILPTSLTGHSAILLFLKNSAYAEAVVDAMDGFAQQRSYASLD